MTPHDATGWVAYIQSGGVLGILVLFIAGMGLSLHKGWLYTRGHYQLLEERLRDTRTALEESKVDTLFWRNHSMSLEASMRQTVRVVQEAMSK